MSRLVLAGFLTRTCNFSCRRCLFSGILENCFASFMLRVADLEGNEIKTSWEKPPALWVGSSSLYIVHSDAMVRLGGRASLGGGMGSEEAVGLCEFVRDVCEPVCLQVSQFV